MYTCHTASSEPQQVGSTLQILMICGYRFDAVFRCMDGCMYVRSMYILQSTCNLLDLSGGLDFPFGTNEILLLSSRRHTFQTVRHSSSSRQRQLQQHVPCESRPQESRVFGAECTVHGLGKHAHSLCYLVPYIAKATPWHHLRCVRKPLGSKLAGTISYHDKKHYRPWLAG